MRGSSYGLYLQQDPKTKKSAASLESEARSLIETAAKQPGIAELLRVYDSWRQFDTALEAHNRLVAPKQVVSSSSSSDPVLRQLL